VDKELKKELERRVDLYNREVFIANDPVSIPRLFTKKQDIEISGLFAAVFSWGNRATIINKSRELMHRMDNAPHEFCLHAGTAGLKKLYGFKHRTFKDTDLLYFIEFLKHHYEANETLESAFTRWMKPGDPNIENALNGFCRYFFSLPDVPARTRKHIASPERNSSCKRLNLYLRWMVRRDRQGVDFGIWKNISPAQLVCPLDVHVARVARRFGLLNRKATDWKAALELTEYLRKLDKGDPVKYDFALFGTGVMESKPRSVGFTRTP
jgi:uncharacterized protein (TIGR02757 family)